MEHVCESGEMTAQLRILAALQKTLSLLPPVCTDIKFTQLLINQFNF